MVTVPRELLQRDLKVLRPRDARNQYAQPRGEFARLAESHALLKLAPGYYALPPGDRLGDPGWRPTLEAVALGVAAADSGVDRVCLMGPSAARVHGAVPRALGIAFVAVPTRRRDVETIVGRVSFSFRDTSKLDLTRVDTELLNGYATSPEQTVLDLGERPNMGGLSPGIASEAIARLAPRVDWEITADLAREQRRRAGFARARWVASGEIDAIPALAVRGPVPALGLRPTSAVDPARFDIELDT